MKTLRNQNGSAIIYSIIVALVMATTGFFMFNQSVTTQKALRGPRIRSAMQSAEGMFRTWAYQPSSYAGCDSTNVAGTCNIAPLVAIINQLQDVDLAFEIDGCIKRPIAPGDPPWVQGTPCGVRFVNPAFDGPTQTLSVTIHYIGNDAVVADTPISIKIPAQILQDARYFCPAATPLFQGFDPVTGSARCGALPPPCAAGSYMTGFNTSTFAPICSVIPGNPTCPGVTDFITGINWSAPGVMSFACTPRVPLPVLWGPPGIAPGGYH